VNVDKRGPDCAECPPDIQRSEDHAPETAAPPRERANLNAIDDLVMVCHRHEAHVDTRLSE